MEKLKELIRDIKKLFDSKFHGTLEVTFVDGVPVATYEKKRKNL